MWTPSNAARNQRPWFRILMWGTIAGAAATGCGTSSPTQPAPNPLTLRCPADITDKSHAGEPVRVSYPAPQSEGGTPPVSMSCIPPSDSTFPPGENAIVCTAADSRGQVAQCGFKVTIVRVPRLAITNFLAFGDSITAGTTSPAQVRAFLGPPESYPFQLHGLLTARYEDQTIAMENSGRGAEDVASGARRLPGELALYKPEALLLLEGANDLLNRRQAAIPDIIFYLRQDVREARNSGARVFLATFPPQRPNTQRGGGAPFVPELNDQIRALAAAEGATLVDLYAAFPADTTGYIGVDGLHPTERGYTLMAQTFFQVIRDSSEVRTMSATAGTSR